MLIAPPFGLLAPGRAGSKDMSAFADQFSLQENGRNVKDFLKKTGNSPQISARAFRFLKCPDRKSW
jgi:hypothetical protein